MSFEGLPVIRTPQPAPLEGQDMPTLSGVESNILANAQSSLGIGLIARGTGRATGALRPDLNAVIPHDTAAKEMADQGYDPSVLPSGDIHAGVLDSIMAVQSAVKRNEDIARRAHLGSTTSFVTGLIGGGADPLFLGLGPIAGRSAQALRVIGAGSEGVVGITRGAGLASRLAAGAAEGGAILAGYTEAQKQFGIAPGDKDLTSYDVLRGLGYGSVLGSGVKAIFGARLARENAIDNILREEGGKTIDTGGATNFGISAKSHPGLDIANLTASDARRIYKEEYWDKIDGDNLPSNMQITALDAAVNQGVDNALKWLKEANGDPVAFNALRREHYESLARENPAKYGKYLPEWLARLGRISLKSINPFFAEQRGPAEDVLANQAESVSRGQLGPATRIASRLEIPTPEGAEDTPRARELAEQDTLDRLGQMQLPTITAYPGYTPIGIGENLRRLADRMSPNEQMASLPPDVKADAAKLAVSQAANDSEGNVEPAIRASMTGDSSRLAEAIPQPGSVFVNERLSSELLARINSMPEEAPKAAVPEGENPDVTNLKAQANEAAQEAEHAHRMAFGEQGTPAKEAIDKAIEDHIGGMLSEDDRLVNETEDMPKAIEAAVRCSLLKGSL